LTTAKGRELWRMHKRETNHEEPMMTRTEMVADVAKRGALAIAKSIVSDGNGPGGTALTEAEFTKMVHDHAQRDRRTGETPDQAFARCFTANTPEGLDFRRAHAIVKNFPNVMTVQPLVSGGVPGPDTRGRASTLEDDALAQLQQLAEEQRRRSPELTIAQAFARVYAAPENATLVAAERMQNRPSAPTVRISG
jgi:hypothetical protein